MDSQKNWRIYVSLAQLKNKMCPRSDSYTSVVYREPVVSRSSTQVVSSCWRHAFVFPFLFGYLSVWALFCVTLFNFVTRNFNYSKCHPFIKRVLEKPIDTVSIRSKAIDQGEVSRITLDPTCQGSLYNSH